MNTKQTLWRIGYAAAHGMSENPDNFFNELVRDMYPHNLHRRDWAKANLELFYNNEVAQINAIVGLKQDRNNA